MAPEEYREIIKTAVYPKTVNNFGVAYTYMGIFDELDEVFEDVKNKDKVFKEKGDVLWYINAFCEEIGLSFPELVNEYFSLRESDVRQIFAYKPLFGRIKKFYRDGKPLDLEEIKNHFLLNIISDLFHNDTREYFEKCLQANYDKLMLRQATGTIQGDGDDREKGA